MHKSKIDGEGKRGGQYFLFNGGPAGCESLNTPLNLVRDLLGTTQVCLLEIKIKS